MQLAKPAIDIGLATNRLDDMLAFWREQAGLRFDHLLKVRRGHDQHRFDALGSVVKVNHHADQLPDAPPSGYRELLIARPGLHAPRGLQDPDGNRVALVPPGCQGVTQIGIRLAVSDPVAHARFLTEAFGLPQEAPGRVRAGSSLLLLEPGGVARSDTTLNGLGWRYITLQVFKADAAYEAALAAGALSALAPVTLGQTARIAMVLDPDGNWIELSQRASITGSLD